MGLTVSPTRPGPYAMEETACLQEAQQIHGDKTPAFPMGRSDVSVHSNVVGDVVIVEVWISTDVYDANVGGFVPVETSHTCRYPVGVSGNGGGDGDGNGDDGTVPFTLANVPFELVGTGFILGGLGLLFLRRKR